MENPMVSVRIHILIPAKEMPHGGEMPVLERVKRLLDAAGAVSPELLDQLGGVTWSLDGQEEAPAGGDDLALAMAQGHLQGATKARVEILLALQDCHPEDCGCRAHTVIEAVRQADELGDDFGAIETLVEDAIDSIL